MGWSSSACRWWLGRSAAICGVCVLTACGSGRQHQQGDTSGNPADTSGSSSAQGTASASASTSSAASASSSSGEVTAATLTTADLDTYEKGMQRQIDAVQQVRNRLAQARSEADTLSVLQAMMPDSLEAVAAREIGAEPQRYDKVVALLDQILAARKDRSLSGTVAARIDTMSLPPEVRKEVRAGLTQTDQETRAADSAATAGMAPPVVAALNAERPVLDSLRLAYAAMLAKGAR